jgi:hypothetical protein
VHLKERPVMNTVIRWHTARWRRVSPGAPGIAIMIAFPVVFLLPVEGTGLFGSALEGTTVLFWLGTFILAATLGRDSGRPTASFLWVHQKGGSVTDLALAHWLLDLAFALAIAAWWIVGWLVANALRMAAPPSHAITLAITAVFVLLIAHALLFPIAAAGWSRGVDALMLLGFLSLLEPFLARTLPALLRRLLHVLVPPFLDALRAGRLRDLPASTAAGELSHLIAFPALAIAVGIWLLHRWRPGTT